MVEQLRKNLIVKQEQPDSKFQIQPLAQSENKLQTPQPQPLQQLQQHHHQQQQQSTAPSPNVIGSQVRIATTVLILSEGKVHWKKKKSQRKVQTENYKPLLHPLNIPV